MKDTKKILRHAIFSALDGQLTYNGTAVPVVDEKLRSGDDSDIYVLLSTQQEQAYERNSSSFITVSSIDIEIIQHSETEVSKDAIDDVYEDILEIIFPSINTIGLTVPSGFQFNEGFRDSCSTLPAVLDGTNSIVVERFRLTFIINQQ